MPQDKTSKSPAPTEKSERGQGTHSGRPNPESPPSHPEEHESGYGGAGGEPRQKTS